jgi:hypothetical protein
VGATGLYVLGGLLGGAGQAITNEAEQRRQDALSALKRQYEVEDRNYNAAADLAKSKQAGENALAVVRATGTENRSTEVVKTQADAYLARLKGSIDLSNTTQIKALEHTYNVSEETVRAALDLKKQLAVAGQTVDHWAVTTDGKMVAFNKQGGVLRYSQNPGSFVPDGESISPDDTGGSSTISGAAEARGKPTGKAPAKAASPGSEGIKAETLAQLGNVYMEISGNPERAAEYRQRYPAMFDANGKLLPKDVLIERVNQRYGG